MLSLIVNQAKVCENKREISCWVSSWSLGFTVCVVLAGRHSGRLRRRVVDGLWNLKVAMP